MLCHISILYSFLWLTFHCVDILHFVIHSSIDGTVSIFFLLLWIMLVWTLEYKFVCGHILFFLVVLGVHCCCEWAFSSCGKQGLLFVGVPRLLIVVLLLFRSTGCSCLMWALEKAQESQCMGLVALQLVVSFWTRYQTHVPCIDRWILWIYAFISLGYIPRSGIAGSHSNTMFNFLRNCQTVSQSRSTSSCFHQQCIRL